MHSAVGRLIQGAGHHLEWRKTASLARFEGENCDLLLVDGASLWRDEAQRLGTCLAMQAGPGGGAAFYFDPAVDPRAKISTPVHLSCRGECGVYRTAAGHWSMRCRLQEQALQEYRARGLD